jgi:hypothetical protein
MTVVTAIATPKRRLSLRKDEADLGFLSVLEDEDHREHEEHAHCHKTGAGAASSPCR